MDNYISTEELTGVYKLKPSLIKKQLGSGIDNELKRKIKSKTFYPLNHPVVKELIKYGRNGMITSTSAKKTYKLNENDLANLICKEVKNPHYSCSPMMKLYYLDQIIEFKNRQFNSANG